MERAKQWKSAKDIFVQSASKLKIELGSHRKYAAWVKNFEGNVVPALLQQLDQLDQTFEKNLKPNNIPQLTEILQRARVLTIRMGQEFHNGSIALEQAIAEFKDQNADPLRRGFKVLKTSLGAIEKSNEAWLSISEDRLKGLTQQQDTFETMAKQFMAVLQAAVSRGLAAAQRIKAKPTKEVYDAEFPKAARDITQQIGNVGKLAGKGHQVPGPQDTSALFNALAPFGNGALQKVDPTHASANEILVLVSQFNKAVKAVQQAYHM